MVPNENDTQEQEIENPETGDNTAEDTTEKSAKSTTATAEEDSEPVFDRDITAELHTLCDPKHENADELCVAMSELEGRPILRFGVLDRRYEENTVVGSIYVGSDANPLFFALPDSLRNELEAEVKTEKGRGNPIFNVIKRRIKGAVTAKLGYTFDKKGADGKIKWTNFEFLGHKTPEASRRNAEFQQRRRKEQRAGGVNGAAGRMAKAQGTVVSEEL